MFIYWNINFYLNKYTLSNYSAYSMHDSASFIFLKFNNNLHFLNNSFICRVYFISSVSEKSIISMKSYLASIHLCKKNF